MIEITERIFIIKMFLNLLLYYNVYKFVIKYDIIRKRFSVKA